MRNEDEVLQGEQDNGAGFDEQSEGIQRVSATSLSQFFRQLIEFENSENTVFQGLPHEYHNKVSDTLTTWYGLTIQQQTQRLDEFVAKRDDMMRDLATTYFEQYEGYTMLNLAAFNGKEQVVEALLMTGAAAKVNEAGNKYKRTALMWGVYNCNWNIVRACIEHKANTQLRDSYGATALKYAEEMLPDVESFNRVWLGDSEEKGQGRPDECRKIIALLKKHSPSESTGVHFAAPGLGSDALPSTNAGNAWKSSIQ